MFVERDTLLSEKEIEEKLEMLQGACETEDDDLVCDVLREVVSTFKKPEEVNIKVDESEEMKNQREMATA